MVVNTRCAGHQDQDFYDLLTSLAIAIWKYLGGCYNSGMQGPLTGFIMMLEDNATLPSLKNEKFHCSQVMK
jgi:hypothetical protein